MSFPAKYPGRCGTCGSQIEAGDEVAFVDDALVHEECSANTVSDAEPLARPVCPRCFTEVSVSGECLC